MGKKRHIMYTPKITYLDKIQFKYCLYCLLMLLLGLIILLTSLYIPKTHSITKEQHSLFKAEYSPDIINTNLIKELLVNLNFPLLNSDVESTLIPRVSGTEGNRQVANHLKKRLTDMGLHTETFAHVSKVPILQKDVGLKFLPSEDGSQLQKNERILHKIRFENIIAETQPNSPHSVVLACHFDSKYRLDESEYAAHRQKLKRLHASQTEYADHNIPEEPEFLGATDSAVPCAMILAIAQTLNPLIQCNRKLGKTPKVSLQYVFFDGEEAFQDWTRIDSLYGSRYLAKLFSHSYIPLKALGRANVYNFVRTQNSNAKSRSKLTENQGNNGVNMIDRMALFVLLDLIGESETQFGNFFPDSSKAYKRLAEIETYLKRSNQLSNANSNHVYFYTGPKPGRLEDDHIPFLEKGMSHILHLISYPFPQAWHRFADDGKNLDQNVIQDLTKILTVFFAEYLGLTQC